MRALLLLAALAFGLSVHAQAQVVPITYVGMDYGAVAGSNAAPWPAKFLIGTARTWDNSNGSGQGVDWKTLQSTNAAPTFTNLDAVVAAYQANGVQRLNYTFGHVPQWASGSSNYAVPPTSFQYYYTFVQDVVSRNVSNYSGIIQEYELWDEANLTDTWTGTVAQMVTFAQNAYPIIKATQPSATVLCPSVFGGGAASWLSQFFAAGGGAYCDAVALHPYPILSSTNTSTGATPPPEQTAQIVASIQYAITAAGLSLPIYSTEGSWNTSTLSVDTNVQNNAAWLSIYYLLQAGVTDETTWYAATSATYGTLISGSTYIAALTTYQAVHSWLAGATVTTPITRQALTNAMSCPNPLGSSGCSAAATGTLPVYPGTCSGTAGTQPTNWSLSNPDSADGVVAGIVATGTEGGVPYEDLRICGTPTSGASGTLDLYFDGGTHIAATDGQIVYFGADLKLEAGSTTNITAIETVLNEQNSGGTYLTTNTVWNLLANSELTSVALNTQNYTWRATMSNASVAYARPYLIVQYSKTVPIDITIRIGGLTVDTGTIYSGSISKNSPSGYTGQVVWDAGGGPTSYTVPSAYTSGFYRDLTGASWPIINGTVTLTNSPIILDSVQTGVLF